MMTRVTRLPLLLRIFIVLVYAGWIASAAHAQGGCVNGGSGGCTVPEIAPGTVTQATALLTGVALWLRTRRRR